MNRRCRPRCDNSGSILQSRSDILVVLVRMTLSGDFSKVGHLYAVGDGITERTRMKGDSNPTTDVGCHVPPNGSPNISICWLTFVLDSSDSLNTVVQYLIYYECQQNVSVLYGVLEWLIRSESRTFKKRPDKVICYVILISFKRFYFYFFQINIFLVYLKNSSLMTLYNNLIVISCSTISNINFSNLFWTQSQWSFYSFKR